MTFDRRAFLGAAAATSFMGIAGRTAIADTSAKTVKAAFIYIAPVGDGGWTWAQNQGRLKVEKALGIKTGYTESVPEVAERVKEVAERYIGRGYNLIVGTAYGYSDAFKELAAGHPDVDFFNATGYTNGPNLTGYYGRSYEAMYLCGIAAGAVSRNGKLGFVAAYPLSVVLWNINAFALGAQSVRPDCEVAVSFTNTWYDPVKEQATAQALIQSGVDIIAQHQDTSGPQIAAEKAGIHSVGYNADMSRFAPHAALTAAIWNWADFFIPAIKSIQSGAFKGGPFLGGLADGVVDIAPLSPSVPSTIRDTIAAKKKSIAAGTSHVFTGPIKKNDGSVAIAAGTTLSDVDLWKMNYLVAGVKGTLPS
jgi:basic membrane protein A